MESATALLMTLKCHNDFKKCFNTSMYVIFISKFWHFWKKKYAFH